MDFSILKEIINLAEQYQTETQADSWNKEAFAAWLGAGKADIRLEPEFDSNPTEDGLISMFIIFMYRYAQFYAKKVLQDTELYSLDDFGIVASLFPDKEYKKIEVLKTSVLEKSAGNEVLKRLLKRQLVQERDNPLDARSKLLSLSDSGRRAFQTSIEQLTAMSTHITGNLNNGEKNLLLSMLVRLHHFHKPYFEQNKIEELSFINA